MLAYYIHWHYDGSADDALFYAGSDDDRLFHHKGNAYKAAEDTLKDIKDKQSKALDIQLKVEYEGYIPTEEENKLAYYLYRDTPVSFKILSRDITFADEE